MKTSKFITFIKDGNNFLSYNTINGNSIRLGATYTDGKDFLYPNLDASMLAQLEKMHFIVDDHDDEQAFVRNRFQNMQKLFDETLYITIEITTACNLSCGFCYQSDWDKRTCITSQTLDSLFGMIQKSDLSHYREINLDLIGGEPMLHQDIVVTIYEKFQELCEAQSLKLSLKLNTNGCLLTPALLSKLRHTDIMLPYLVSQDYDSLITFRNKKNTKKVIEQLRENIKEWTDILNAEPTNCLIFRFNANHNNIHHIANFFHEIASYKLENYQIEIVNTKNYEQTTFVNHLSDKDFTHWYIETVLPLCHSHKLKLPIKPRNALSRCKGRRMGSFKLFADGRIGLCNGINYNPALPLIAQLGNLSDINTLYREEKTYNYVVDNPKCATCKMVFLCGGDSPCGHTKCSTDLEPLKKFVLMKSKL